MSLSRALASKGARFPWAPDGKDEIRFVGSVTLEELSEILNLTDRRDRGVARQREVTGER